LRFDQIIGGCLRQRKHSYDAKANSAGKPNMLNDFKHHSFGKLIYYLCNTSPTALRHLIDHRLIIPYSSFRIPASAKKNCLVISGCPGDPFRYRCEHQAVQLESLGLTTDICYASQIRDSAVVDCYEWIWLHRVSYTDNIAALIEAAQRSGKPLVFDTDDLVFNEKAIPHMRAIESMSKREVEQVYVRARGYHKTLSRCNSATVSTDYLREAVVKLFPGMRCFVTPNMLSDAQLDLAEQALKGQDPGNSIKNNSVTIGYFSGTRTHNVDFKECADVLIRILDNYLNVRLVLVGYIEIGREFARFGRRVEQYRFVPWQQLSRLLSNVDINLAPLELDNPFTACKSDLKYMEAAIMGIPTVASAVGSFVKSIEHGANGYLCLSGEDWFNCLTALIEDPGSRRKMGNVARQRVLDSRTIKCGAQHLSKTLLGTIKD
jgi:glycosyltransferase involved in cell wall biosynthesis